MIRFRNADDEYRYNRLMTEVYLRIAKTLGPSQPGLVSEILRNLGKLQQLVYTEGIRQGAAASVVAQLTTGSEPETLGRLRATELHRQVYGDADTPLAEVERLAIEAAGIDHEPLLVLEDRPMEFAPLTLAEAVAAGAVLPEHAPEVAVSASSPGKTLAEVFADEPDSDEDIEVELAQVKRWLDEAGEPAQDQESAYVDGLSAKLEATVGRGPVPEGASPEMPDQLDRMRTIIQHQLDAGWTPESYSDVVFKLHQQMMWDAAFIDLQLSGPMGRTVLDQCGLFNLQTTALDSSAFRFVDDPRELTEPPDEQETGT